MEIRNRLLNDMKEAMKNKDQMKLEAIRFLQAAIKNKEIDMRPDPITEEEVMGVIKRMIKQRKESAEQYQAANRQDLVDKEMAELKILETYLPAQMAKEQVEAIVTATIAELKASSVKDMGPVMKAVIAKTAGQADNKMVSEIIKSKLT
ncbi:MAG: GatB/YqeY domain-containing protein [Pseudobdellovibrionaceae bacterium]|nr:GatB/YqeY domain-containing protein [Pseudomonadota bacterium]